MFRRFKCTNPQCVMNRDGRILMTTKPVYERISCEECGASMTQVAGDDRVVFVGGYPDTVLSAGSLPIDRQGGGILSALFGRRAKARIADPDIRRYPSFDQARGNPTVLRPDLFDYLQTADLFLVRQGDCGATTIVARCPSHHLRVPLSQSPPVGIHVEAHRVGGYDVFGVYTLVWDNSKVPWYTEHTVVPYDYVGANEEEMSRPFLDGFEWRKLFYLLTQEATQIIFVDEHHRIASIRNAALYSGQARQFDDVLNRLAACSGRQIPKPDLLAIHPEYNRAVKMEEVQTRFPRIPRGAGVG